MSRTSPETAIPTSEEALADFIYETHNYTDCKEKAAILWPLLAKSDLAPTPGLPWWKILADNWRGRNGNSTTGDSVRNSCADELEKWATRAASPNTSTDRASK